MNKDDFFAAKCIEKDGWEFEYVALDGDMIFTRSIAGTIYTARVRVDQ